MRAPLKAAPKSPSWTACTQRSWTSRLQRTQPPVGATAPGSSTGDLFFDGRVSKPNDLWVRSPSHSLGGMHRVREPRCIDDCAVRVASGSTMECSRPLIFSFSSHKEEKEKLPHKKKGGKGRFASPPSAPRPRLSPFRRGRGAQTFGLARFTRRVALNAEDDSEQNRLSPPPLTVNDASEGIFLFVIK